MPDPGWGMFQVAQQCTNPGRGEHKTKGCSRLQKLLCMLKTGASLCTLFCFLEQKLATKGIPSDRYPNVWTRPFGRHFISRISVLTWTPEGCDRSARWCGAKCGVGPWGREGIGALERLDFRPIGLLTDPQKPTPQDPLRSALKRGPIVPNRSPTPISKSNDFR
jgi:hypothetical protein